MSYPQIVDYNDAVQQPQHAFTDAELQRGRVATTQLGLPLALSGGFALTYTVTSGARKYAVRCFHREVPEAQSRYAAVSTKLRALASPYFVTFEFQPQGVRIRGKPYPIVKMDWVEGETLGEYLNANAHNASALAALRTAFANLAQTLENEGIAHGDLQNENVIVQGGNVRLIDYDGMFVTGMQAGRGSEVGQKHFQHPQRSTRDFGPNMDRFSLIAIDVSLEALQADPTLHRKFREGGQTIIFKANDFADPSASDVFDTLRKMPTLKEGARKFEAVCRAPIGDVPSVSDFVAGRNIPAVVAAPRATTQAAVKPTIVTYLGAYDVVDACEFDKVVARVGHKVELVGQILSLRFGRTRRGGRPYVFINFGVWNEDSVKITIWSEGLKELSDPPSPSWQGRWISVTGLIEPVYHGNARGRSYRSVGITVASDAQIIKITEKDARFRLGATGATSNPTTRTSTSNADILRDLSRTSAARPPTPAPTPTRRPSAPPPPPPARTRNEHILRTIQPPPPPPPQTRSPPPRYTPPAPQRSGDVPGWVWWVGGAVVLFLLSQCGG